MIRQIVFAMSVALCAGCSAQRGLAEVQRVRSGQIDVILLAPTAALKPTRNYCTLEFRAGPDRHLVDVGTLHVQTTMSMEGEPMSGVVTPPTRVGTGRYEIQMVLAMTGAWRIHVAWDSDAGAGEATFDAVVR